MVGLQDRFLGIKIVSTPWNLNHRTTTHGDNQVCNQKSVTNNDQNEVSLARDSQCPVHWIFMRCTKESDWLFQSCVSIKLVEDRGHCSIDERKHII